MSDKQKYNQMNLDTGLSLGIGMDMDMDIDIDIETQIETEINTETFNIHIKHNFACIKHKKNDSEISLSPPKYNCKNCKKRNISGYSNPLHCSNPFSYLYLVPMLCIDCANKNKKCRWC